MATLDKELDLEKKEGLVGMVYYAAIVLDDYSQHMYPTKSKLEALTAIQRVRDKHGNRVLDGYVITRDMDNKKYKNGKRL